MYEVTTAIKTIATNVATEADAMAIATETFKTHNYVEVKKVVTTSPWYAVSVKILMRWESSGKIFQKSVDNLTGICYNDYSKREEHTEMLNDWYMNPELHDEDFAELAELLAEEDAEG